MLLLMPTRLNELIQFPANYLIRKQCRALMLSQYEILTPTYTIVIMPPFDHFNSYFTRTLRIIIVHFALIPNIATVFFSM